MLLPKIVTQSNPGRLGLMGNVRSKMTGAQWPGADNKGRPRESLGKSLQSGYETR